ncbi:COesterase-domain-containing protein [Gyrodon lividus]|nr:COesterase-domain-containing protein [Gyrodon lividus]
MLEWEILASKIVERLALYWVKYISAFGGDPTKVTSYSSTFLRPHVTNANGTLASWGESAGAASVALQMVMNGGNTDGLFRAAFMESGSSIPVGGIIYGRKYYDALGYETGCSTTSDTLRCLREVPYETLLDAVNQSPGIFSYQSLVLGDIVLLTVPELMRYSADITQGSLFDTSVLNALTPQFKRLAAFQGDAVLQAPRRFLQNRSGEQNL